MNLALNIRYNLESETCCTCGIAMFIPDDYKRRLIKSRSAFYCIKGHRQYYTGKSEETRLKERLKMERETNQFLRNQNEKERNRTRAQKAAKTRLKNKIKHGVCPCCQRTFKQLAAHMKNKHPDYVDGDIK